MKKNQPLNGIRWTARITGTLLVLFTLAFGIANFIDGLSRNNESHSAPFSALILIIFFIWAIALAGLVLALRKEGLGGLISLAGFAMMYILNLFNKAAPNREGVIFVFLIFSIPSLLYLYYWWKTKDIFQNQDNAEPEGSGKK
jgi:uncharacterized membrane protein